jgi:exopolysaccharide production protein ExoZ
MLPPPRSTESLGSIQMLRAVAALAVVWVHLRNEAVHRLGAVNPLPEWLHGNSGVDLFFVISGFIMVYSSEQLFGQRSAPGHFFLRRIIRIVPLYWASTLAVVACLIAIRDRSALDLITWQAFVGSFLFIPTPLANGLMLPIHILGWTLNYEMFFYAVFAGALLMSRRYAVFTITGLFALMTFCGLYFAPLPQPLKFWCSPIILEFCFGMWIAIAYREGIRLPRLVSWLLVLAGFAALLASSVFANETDRLLRWGVPAAAIVAGAALIRAPRERSAVGRVFVLLGDASYSIYLVHSIVILMMPTVAVHLRVEVSRWPWSYIAVCAVAALAGSMAAYWIFERPVTRALQRRLREKRQAMSPVIAQKS